jgi:hypothetical protein
VILFLVIHIRIHIVTILALIPIDIIGSQVKPLKFYRGPSSRASGGDGLVIVDFITFIFLIPAATWHPEIKYVIHAIIVYQDVLVGASDLSLLKCHFLDQIIKKNRIVNTHFFHANRHGRRWVLCLLDLTVDCRKSVVIHPLVMDLQECVPGIHQECTGVCNTRRGQQLATQYSAAGCDLTIVILVVEVVRAISYVRFSFDLEAFG